MKTKTRALQRFRNRLTPFGFFLKTWQESIAEQIENDTQDFKSGKIDFSNPPRDLSEFKVSVTVNPERYKIYNSH